MKRVILILLSIFIMACMLPICSVAENDGESGLVTDTWDGSYDMGWYDDEAVLDMLSSSGKKITVIDGKEYYVTKYKEGSQFVIDSAEQLAGLARLVNNEERDLINDLTKGWFYNCKFLIKLDVIDLGGQDWTPIGYAFERCFAGKLVGDAPNNENGALVIKNMTVNVGDNVTTAGLVGSLAGGGIENITLQNARINYQDGSADSFVGSFVGYFSNGILANLSSDAQVCVSGENNQRSCVGGIAGSTYSASIADCFFTGSIASCGAVSGGIIGTTEGGVTVSSCAVSSPSIRAEYNGDAEPYTGCGGIIGHSIDKARAVQIENCYVNARLGGVNYTGGIVGSIYNNRNNLADISIINCQFEGVIAAEKLMRNTTVNNIEKQEEITNTDNGSFIGAALVKTDIVLNDCVNTGVAASYLKDSNAEFAFIGSIASGSQLVASNTYSAIGVPYVNGNINCPTLLDGNENLDFYSDENADGKWMHRKNSYPVLRIVHENASVVKSNADYSCFNNGGNLSNASKMQGLVNILFACGNSAESYIEMYDCEYTATLVEAVCFDDSFDDSVEKILKSRLVDVDNVNKYIVSPEDDGILAQKTTDNGNTYNIRVLAKIKGKDYECAGFEYMLSYVDEFGVTHYSSVQRIENITCCYKSVLALDESGNTYTYYAGSDPADGEEYYFIGFVLTDLYKTVDYRLYVSAEVINTQKISGQAVTFDFCAEW